jgi:hypothetical protein
MTEPNRACPAEMQADGSNRRWVWILLTVLILGAAAGPPWIFDNTGARYETQEVW